MNFKTKNYYKHFDGLDLTDAQKDEYILIIWNYCVSFIEQRLGQHPVQMARAAANDNSVENAGGECEPDETSLKQMFCRNTGSAV